MNSKSIGEILKRLSHSRDLIEVVGIWVKPLPFVEGGQSDELGVKKAMSNLASVVKELCGILPNLSFWVPLRALLS